MGGAYVTTDHVDRKLASILAADMVGYSRLVEADEAGTIARQKAYREELIDPEIAAHKGRIVKTTGDGLLVEFGSVVDAVACAAAWQHAMAEHEGGMPEDRRIQYRIGINLGDIVIDGDDILGDGVNIAARLEGLAAPGGVCISEVVYTSVKGKLDLAYDDLGEQTVKNITQPIRVYRVRPGAGESPATEGVEGGGPVLELPDRPSIAVLPFVNMSGDAEQEYFSDGITEDIITELSRFRSLFVIARNSSFAYKGQSVNIRDIARALGVAYVVEGSVRKAGNRVRITAQLIEAEQGNHVWAERYDHRLGPGRAGRGRRHRSGQTQAHREHDRLRFLAPRQRAFRARHKSRMRAGPAAVREGCRIGSRLRPSLFLARLDPFLRFRAGLER
jgi:TolB-like protein